MNSILKSVLALLFFTSLSAWSATREGEQKSVDEILADKDLFGRMSINTLNYHL
jgi:hypothetical protein